MVSFKPSADDAIRRGVCQTLAASNALNEAFRDFIPPGPANTYYPNFGGLLYNNLCNTPQPDPPNPPFNGGQCPVLYDVSTEVEITNLATGGKQILNRTDRLGGPIYGIQKRQQGNSEQVGINHNDGSGGVDFFGVASIDSRFAAITAYSVTSIVRVDGQPDNCGNPGVERPPAPPPGWNNGNIDIDWTDNSGNNITTNVDIEIGIAFTNNDGDLILPVQITQNGNQTFTNNYNISNNTVQTAPTYNPNGPNNPGTGSNNGPSNVTTDDPVPPSPTQSTDPPIDPDMVEIIRAVIVTVNTINTNTPTQILQESNPDIYAPNLGYVQFFCRIGNTTRGAWTHDIPVKNLNQIIECPWEGGAYAVEGTPRKGVTWTLSPVYKKSEKVATYT